MKATLIALMVAMLALLGFAGSAGAADHVYQIPSDGNYHTIVGSEPYMANRANEGCHHTGTYSGQSIVFCVWIGVNNGVGGEPNENEMLYAVKWRCYDSNSNTVQCGKVALTVDMQAWNYSVWLDSRYTARCQASTGGAYNVCSTGTNNTGWIHDSQFVTLSAGGGTTYYLYNPLWVQTANDYLNNVLVGTATTDTYQITDSY